MIYNYRYFSTSICKYQFLCIEGNSKDKYFLCPPKSGQSPEWALWADNLCFGREEPCSGTKEFFSPFVEVAWELPTMLFENRIMPATSTATIFATGWYRRASRAWRGRPPTSRRRSILYRTTLTTRMASELA